MRFTIRDLLWLTVVVALAVPWWIERRASAQARATSQQQVKEIKVLQTLNQLKLFELIKLQRQLDRVASPSLASPDDKSNPDDNSNN
jgi:hypothetical protein